MQQTFANLKALRWRLAVGIILLLGVIIGFSIKPTTQPESISNTDFADINLLLPEEMVSEEAEYGVKRLSKEATIQGAMNYWQMMLSDENGEIPADGISQGQKQVQTMRTALQGRSPQDAGVTRDSWEWIGPGNIGGAVNAIVFHPNFASNRTMWAGTAGGGIWKSTNGGEAWNPINDFMANLGVSSLVMDPTDPSIMYAGTGELINTASIRGAGVFKSTDGGDTWSQLPSTTDVFNWSVVNELAISPNGQVLLAATQNGGVFRSTDGGTSWSTGLSPLVGGSMYDVDFHPTDSNQAVASNNGGQAWYTIDGGSNWTAATGLGGRRVELAYAPGNPSIVYASVWKNASQLHKSTDGGKQYQPVNNQINHMNQGFLHNAIWVDPANANNIVLGGLDLWRSNDGGASLTRISRWQASPKSAHADHRVIVSPPNYNGTTVKAIYNGNDGGVYLAQDVYKVQSLAGWKSLNNNLGVTQFYGAAVSPNGLVVGGTQDNGDLRYLNNPQKWSAWAGGDGGYSAADQADSNYVYGEYVYLAIHRSTNGGASQEDIYGQYWYHNGQSWEKRNHHANIITDVANEQANFIAPFILDPNESNRMLAGGISLWRSNNVKAAYSADRTGGPEWFAIKDPSNANISAIAVAPGNSDIVWVGHNNGRVYKSTNGTDNTPSWTENQQNLPSGRVVTRFTIDPNNSDTVYVTFGGFSSANVWKTTNGGTSWTQLTGAGNTALPAIPVFSLAIHPTKANWLYVGTELGVFASEDGGQTWTPSASTDNDGPANVRVVELFWKETTLYAATHGRGIYRAKINEDNPVIICHELTTNSTPSGNGSIILSPPPNCSGGTQYSAGTEVTLLAKPSAGFKFESWTGAATSSDNKIKLTMNNSQNITAVFSSGEACYQLTTGINAIEDNFAGHAIEADPQPNCTGSLRLGSYTAGTVVTLKAIVGDDNFFDEQFASWSGNAPSTSSDNTSITMSSNKVVTASFAIQAGNDGFDDAFDLFSETQLRSRATEMVTISIISTVNAQSDPTDPDACETGKGGASVWYKFTAQDDGFLRFDAEGSTYDTVMAVFEGESKDDLELLECDDDSEDDGENYDDEFSDDEFDEYFDDDFENDDYYDDFFDDFFEDDFFEDDEYFDEGDFFDFLDEDDFYDEAYDSVPPSEVSQLEGFVEAGKTYYLLISDATEPEPFGQTGDDDFFVDDNFDDLPQGGLLTLRTTFTVDEGESTIYLPLLLK